MTDLSRAEQIRDRIFIWLDESVQHGSFDEPGFHCFRDVPAEFRMFPCTVMLEYHLYKGGVGQVMWNCFAHWRELLDICEEGYRLMGADAQAAAIPVFRTQCARSESACREARHRADELQNAGEDWLPEFGEFTAQMFLNRDEEAQSVFSDRKGLDEIRLSWLARNEKHVLKLLGPEKETDAKENIPRKRRWKLGCAAAFLVLGIVLHVVLPFFPGRADYTIHQFRYQCMVEDTRLAMQSGELGSPPWAADNRFWYTGLKQRTPEVAGPINGEFLIQPVALPGGHQGMAILTLDMHHAGSDGYLYCEAGLPDLDQLYSGTLGSSDLGFGFLSRSNPLNENWAAVSWWR